MSNVMPFSFAWPAALTLVYTLRRIKTPQEEASMPRIIAITVSLLLTCQVHAATLIELKTPQGQGKVYRDAGHTRLENGDGSYVLIDSKAKTFLMVTPKERQVRDLSQLVNAPVGAQNKSPLAVRFKSLGAGPAIAGYKTTRYQYSANGKACGALLASKQALQDAALQDSFEMMERMGARADAMMQIFNKGTDPCQRAGTRFSEHFGAVGIPMRVSDVNGKLISEITRIDKKAALPPGAFTVPAGYRTLNTGEMIRQLPNVQDIMRQMQQR